jgi:hypothetical protein
MSILRIVAVPRDDYSSVVNTIRNRASPLIILS